MSEESSSTPLRLKPKLRVEADGASATSTSAPDTVAGDAVAQVEGEAGQRLRLKPRLAAAEAGEPKSPGPVEAVEAPSSPTTVEPKVRLKPRLSAGSEGEAAAVSAPADASPPPVVPSVEAPAAIVDQPAPAPMIGGFKLKPKAASEEPPPLPAAEAIGKAGEPAGAAGAVEAPSPPKFRVKPSPDVVKSFDETAKVTPLAAEAKRRSPVLVLALIVVLLGGGGYYGYYGYRTFLAPAGEAAPEPAEAAPAEAPASLAGQMVAKARDAAAAQAGRFEGMDDPGVESRSPSAATAVPAPADGVMAAMPPRVEAPAPAPEPSAAFTRFVTEMRISGVFQGDPPRALINGRTIRAGEPIDIGLGIVFTGIDVDRRLILMREASGAIAAKKY